MAVGLGIVVLGLVVIARAHAVYLNTTPSEPRGLYWRVEGGLKPGAIIAFLAPAASFPYADQSLSVLHRIPILKAIGAGPGDRVCSEPFLSRAAIVVAARSRTG
jgi:type IV secretory pathway protease TraF